MRLWPRWQTVLALLALPWLLAAAVVAKLHDAVVGVLGAADVREKLVQSGAMPSPTSSEEFGKLLSDEFARWGRVVKEQNVKGE